MRRLHLTYWRVIRHFHGFWSRTVTKIEKKRWCGGSVVAISSSMAQAGGRAFADTIDDYLGTPETRLAHLSRALLARFSSFRHAWTPREGSSAETWLAKKRSLGRALLKLLDTPPRTALDAHEWFVLLCASVVFDATLDAKRALRLDTFARPHAMLQEHHKRYGLSASEAKVIGEVCRAFSMENLDYLVGHSIAVDRHGPVRVALRAAVLRLADALSFVGVGRAPFAASYRAQQLGRRSPTTEVVESIEQIAIVGAPDWVIALQLKPGKKGTKGHYELVGYLQDELNAVNVPLMAQDIWFREVSIAEAALTKESTQKTKNPFLGLASFDARSAAGFAGRDREINQILTRIYHGGIIVIMGESGVGKSSLVEAGVIPRLAASVKVLRYSCQTAPTRNLVVALGGDPAIEGRSRLSVAVDQFFAANPSIRQIVMIGDHLEQLFTVDTDSSHGPAFFEDIARLLFSDQRVRPLFCIREDYLPALLASSQRIPALFERQNLFHLYRLSRESCLEALRKASAHAHTPMSAELMDSIVDELCQLGEGLVYPPYLQVVGRRIYSQLPRRGVAELGRAQYLAQLGSASQVVNDYLSQLLAGYEQDRPMISRILSCMTTVHRTKKRVTIVELQAAVPDSRQLEVLLGRLVKDRIVRRSLGEYELVHDLLAERIIKLEAEEKLVSRTVRKALDYIAANYADPKLHVATVVHAAGVSQHHLLNMFKRSLGISIKQRITQVRISNASKLIEGESVPMAEIAGRVGFASPTSFSRAFHKEVKCSPMAYRKIKRAERLSLRNDGAPNGTRERRGLEPLLAAESRGRTDSTGYDVFLSYHSKDIVAVEGIALQLRKKNVQPWFDKWDLPPGEKILPALEDAMGVIDVAVAFIGRDGHGPWQSAEVEHLLRLNLNKGRRVIPALLPGATLERAPLTGFLSGLRAVCLGDDGTGGIDQLVWGITGKAESLAAPELADHEAEGSVEAIERVRRAG
jgi:AraC-like DNA-binding protein